MINFDSDKSFLSRKGKPTANKEGASALLHNKDAETQKSSRGHVMIWRTLLSEKLKEGHIRLPSNDRDDDLAYHHVGAANDWNVMRRHDWAK